MYKLSCVFGKKGRERKKEEKLTSGFFGLVNNSLFTFVASRLKEYKQ